MVIRYATLAALGAVSIWAVITVGASEGQWLLAGTDEAEGQGNSAFWLLAAIAVLMTCSLARFLFLGRPPIVDGWYEQHKPWIYVILGGGLLYAAYVVM
jgi:hypothetical protein